MDHVCFSEGQSLVVRNSLHFSFSCRGRANVRRREHFTFVWYLAYLYVRPILRISRYRHVRVVFYAAFSSAVRHVRVISTGFGVRHLRFFPKEVLCQRLPSSYPMTSVQAYRVYFNYVVSRPVNFQRQRGTCVVSVLLVVAMYVF